MTEAQVRKLLLNKAKKYAKYRGSKGIRAWCAYHGLAHSHVSEFMNGHRGPSSEMLNALRLEWRIVKKPRIQLKLY